MAVLAGVAFGAGMLSGAGHVSPEEALAKTFVRAWERGDIARMYTEVAPATRRRLTIASFAAAYRDAMDTATATGLAAGRPRSAGSGIYRVPVRVTTRVFGIVRADLDLPLTGSGDGAKVDWAPNLTFPGVPRGATLTRRTSLPTRAPILARDRTPLAQGADRSSPLGPVAAAVVGSLGPAPPDRAEHLRALGYPDGAQVGLSGLERIFDERLAGRPGGELTAAGRVLAAAVPLPAPALHTTISPRVQQAVVSALAGRLGGIVALRPRTGEILGAAGIGFSGLQPPGSTFKLVTLTSVLEAGIASPRSVFPIRDAAILSGVALQNANGEFCGGTLAQAFAQSCNSVFAPLGAKLGARRLVATAERYGFNRPPGVPGAATSSIPPADQIGDDLAVGSSAIGQGRVQATALQMARVAATIALHGRRPRLTLDFATARRPVRFPRVVAARVARTVERLMLGVVRTGTGTAAAIPGVEVAGKTGTAELKTTVTCKPDPARPDSCPPAPPPDPTDTDAWFASYAPVGHPRIAVAVMLVRAGAGGDTAAPAARQVLLAGLARG